MAAVSTKPVSNIAVAFAAQSAVSWDMPGPRDGLNGRGDHGLDGFVPRHRGMLLTPPSSLSPTLAAHKHRAGMSPTDIDLQDAVEHAAAQDLPSSALSREALAGLEAAGQITAVMLAKYHLPKIFLGHGSMPVRDIMAHLAQSVPGYSRIPPAKARRLVVAALEHRDGGGLHGEVIFEKVGWGRWHVKGQSSQGSEGMPIRGPGAPPFGLTPPASVDSAGGLLVPRSRNERDVYSGSWAAGSMESSRDEEMADNMSLDGSESSDSDTSEMDLENDLDDQTDEEDWSAIGPDALRQGLRQGARGNRIEHRDYNYLSRTSGARFRPVPLSRTAAPPFTSFPAYASSGVLGNSNTSEREAIEALVAMGSM